MSRYIENTYNENEISHEVTKEWLLERAQRIISALAGRPKNGELGEPYTGESGIAYAFLYAAPHFAPDCIEHAREILKKEREYSSHRHRNRRYLTGLIGTLTVMASDPQSSQKDIEEQIKQCGEDFTLKDESIENELFNGRAGFLGAILWLRKIIDPRMFMDLSQHKIQEICQFLLFTGARVSDKSGVPRKPPLMYYWHDTMYIGAAHGLAGILLILMSFLNEFSESADPKVKKRYPSGLKERIRQSVDWLVSIQTPDGGFASSLDYVTRPKPYDLVHWCHGPTGVIPTLLKAYQVYGDSKYLQAAELGGEQIWRKGILKKGPGLCHGVSGGGYAFLFLWKVTGNQKWLNRAKTFAWLLFDNDIRQQQREPDSPYSLFEGWAGALCFVVNLLPENIQNPRFPLFPYFN